MQTINDEIRKTLSKYFCWAESYWVPMTQFRILKRERNKTLSRWRTTIGSSIDSLINA